jgi:hypothetical protein
VIGAEDLRRTRRSWIVVALRTALGYALIKLSIPGAFLFPRVPSSDLADIKRAERGFSPTFVSECPFRFLLFFDHRPMTRSRESALCIIQMCVTQVSCAVTSLGDDVRFTREIGGRYQDSTSFLDQVGQYRWFVAAADLDAIASLSTMPLRGKL